MHTLYLWLDTGRDACTNMGIDEAMLYEASRGASILRIYWFEPHAATIGFFQRLLDAVDLEACRWYGVKVVRRITGGGSVYHDNLGEVTYSIAVPAHLVENMRVDESFRFLSRWLLYALEELGVEGGYAGYNDIVVEGRKVSGNAQVRRGGGVLQHGTLMYATRLSILVRVLRIPPGKRRVIQERVTTLSQVLGRRIERDEVIDAIVRGVKRWSGEAGFKLLEIPEELRSRLVRLGESLSWRYCSGEWLWRR